MRGVAGIFGLVLLCFGQAWAGTVTFSEQVGNYFAFRNMSETGPSIPPSVLQTPSFITNPTDAIKFSPSAFVVVENQGPDARTSSLSSQLKFDLQALTSTSLEELKFSVTGTWGSGTYEDSPVGSADVGLAVNLRLVFGGVVGNFAIPVTKNVETWAGNLSITQQFLDQNLPAAVIGQLNQITADSQVTASATWAWARSQITYLDVSAKPVPEPGSSSLLLAGMALWGLCRSFRRRVS